MPRSSAGTKNAKKPPESGGFLTYRSAAVGSEPLGAAPVAAIAVPAAIAVHATLKTMVAPPALAAEPASHMGQDGEPAFLAVVEGLVERVGRIGDLLQRGGRGRHIVGALAQPRHRVVG